MDKVTKTMAVYVQPGSSGGVYAGDPAGKYHCAGCGMYAPSLRSCTVVAGDIAPNGGCVFWNGGATMSAEEFKSRKNAGRVERSWAYEVAPQGFSCKRCRFYGGEKEDNCMRVKGHVEGDGCCDLWEKK